ncbi:MAG: hypothetical protein IE878_06635 [Epsilonproteobacteria bacterium]|nr:hypothetical protein [Campylobacterota bacterium]
MKKILLASLILFVVSVQDICADNVVLTQAEVKKVEMGMLKGAMQRDDVKAIASVALSFLLTSEDKSYDGDREKLHKKAVFLSLYCAKHKDIATTLFVITKYKQVDPKFALLIAKEFKNATKDDMEIKLDARYYNIIMLYASIVLDSYSQNKDEVNEAIETIMALRNKTPEMSFYLAYLFNAIGNTDIADMFLNEACHAARPNSKVYQYCTSGSDIEQEDLLEKKVSNPDCKKDIGKRCK